MTACFSEQNISLRDKSCLVDKKHVHLLADACRGLLVWWSDSQFGCERSWVRLPCKPTICFPKKMEDFFNTNGRIIYDSSVSGLVLNNRH